MYHDHFGLTGNPFRHSPSAEFFFNGLSHREALAALQWGLSDPTGLVLLTGDVGTGKTTVVRELFSRETRDVRAVLVRNPRIGFEGILESVIRQLGIESREGRGAMLEALAQAAELRRVVIVIDEAQQLSDEVLEEFRLLSNSSPEHLQLMLVGQPELLGRLSSPSLRQLNQRIAIRTVLAPLGVNETIDYLRHRVRVVGGNIDKIFSWRALRALARSSQGIPRRANILSHNAMLLAYSAGSGKVRVQHVATAVREYDQTRVPRAALVADAPESVWRRSLTPAVVLAGLVAFNLVRYFWSHPAAPSPRASVAARSPEVSSTPHQPATVWATSPKAPYAGINAAAEYPGERVAAEPVVKASTKSILGGNTPPATLDPQPMPTENPSRAGAAPPAVPSEGQEVVVRGGDTLSAIAERYSDPLTRIDVQELVADNPEIRDANLIYPGERLRLKPKTADEQTHE